MKHSKLVEAETEAKTDAQKTEEKENVITSNGTGVLIDFGDTEITTVTNTTDISTNDFHPHHFEQNDEEETFSEFSPSSAATAASSDIFKYCSYCKRSFGVHVIIKHETICGKLFRKKHFNV